MLFRSRDSKFASALLLASTTLQQTSAARSDQTNLGTRRACTRNSGWVANVLVISSSVRVLHGVHGRTTDLWPRVALTRYLWKLLPAFKMGLSPRPPPATIPTCARHCELTVFLEPEGKRKRDFLPSSEWPTIIQLVPEARAKRPRSEDFSSHMLTTVPSGILFRGSTLPIVSCAFEPQYTNCPVCSWCCAVCTVQCAVCSVQ